ncbi:hypothetical protein [Streptomyces daliensis]
MNAGPVAGAGTGARGGGAWARHRRYAGLPSRTVRTAGARTAARVRAVLEERRPDPPGLAELAA